MTILDKNGNPMTLDKKTLGSTIATPTKSGVRAVKTKSVASGLNPTKCAKIIKSANEGDIFDFLTVAEQAEEMSAHYFSVLQTRKLAVRGIDPVIKAASDDDKDQEIADEVKKLVDSAAFADLKFNLLDAISKGYSICEIIYDTSGKYWTPSQFVWQDPRNFTFDKETRTLPLLLDDDAEPRPLDYGKFVFHTPKLKSGTVIRGGLARVILWPLMFSQFSERDWMAFTEVFGMPVRVGKYKGKPTEEDIKTLWQAVVGIASDSAAVIPESMDIDFVTSSNSAKGDAIFAKAAEHFEASISKAVLGQTMTTDDGSSNAQAQVHNDVRMDILEADAMALASTIQRDLIDTFVLYNFGSDVTPPSFSLPVPKPEDVSAFVESVVKLVPFGLKIGTKDIYDKLGISEPSEEAEILSFDGGEKISGTKQADLNKLHLNASEDADELDEIEEEYFNDFVKTSGSNADAILALLFEAESYKDFKQKLDQLDLNDADKVLAENLTSSTFLSRAFGDLND